MRHTHIRLGLAGVLILGLLAAACGKAASAGSAGSNGLWVRIASPAGGATVSEPFVVKLQASVPLGDPSTGRHHVHLCFDGQSCSVTYLLAYGNSVSVSGLTPGRHTMEASLRNADHSDAGPSARITLTVAAAGTGAGTAGSPIPTGSSNGY